MEETNLLYLSMQFLLFSFLTALFFYAIEKLYNLYLQREIIAIGRKNVLDNNAYHVNESEKERKKKNFTHDKFLDPNFVEEFRKYSSEYCRFNPDDFDKFGEYITSELNKIKSEYNKKKLENEIRNTVVEIAKQDMNMFSSNISAKAHIPNNVAEPEIENLKENKNIQHNI